MKTTPLQELRNHLANTDFNVLQAQWKEIEENFTAGPLAFEYLKFLKNDEISIISRSIIPTEFNFLEINTPDFLGCSFLRNIAA